MLSPSTPSSTSKRLFPLHLTPFEKYMFVDDRPAYPMTFIMEFEFSGNLNRAAFEIALDQALLRHPLLGAIIRPAKQQKDCWVRAGDTRPVVSWGGIGDPLEFENGEFIDLRREVGLRLWVRHNENRAVVTAQLHHSACDGIGSYQFLGDLFHYYAVQTGHTAEDLLPLDPTDLRKRGQSIFDPKRFYNEQGRVRSEWGEASRLFFTRISALQPARRTNPEPKQTPFPGIRSYVFEKPEYRDLRLAAQGLAQTPNDLLLEKLFVTLRQWNRQHKALGLPESLCVMMPMDLREAGGPRFSAANIVTYSLIRRRGRPLRDADALAKSLRQEMAFLKRDRHQTRFMNMVNASERYPRMRRFVLSGGRCFATAVMSNTGDPTRHFYAQFPRENNFVRCGNLLLEEISGVPPMRAKTRATISIFTYRRRLKICLRCDPHHFSVDDTQRLLDMYVENLQKVVKT